MPLSDLSRESVPALGMGGAHEEVRDYLNININTWTAGIAGSSGTCVETVLHPAKRGPQMVSQLKVKRSRTRETEEGWWGGAPVGWR